MNHNLFPWCFLVDEGKGVVVWFFSLYLFSISIVHGDFFYDLNVWIHITFSYYYVKWIKNANEKTYFSLLLKRIYRIALKMGHNFFLPRSLPFSLFTLCLPFTPHQLYGTHIKTFMLHNNYVATTIKTCCRRRWRCRNSPWAFIAFNANHSLMYIISINLRYDNDKISIKFTVCLLFVNYRNTVNDRIHPFIHSLSFFPALFRFVLF